MTAVSKFDVENVTARNAYVAGVTTLDGNRFAKFAGNGRSLYVSSVDLLTDKLGVRKVLAKAQFILPTSQEQAAYLSAAESITGYPRRQLIEHPGWTGVHYAEPSGYVHSPSGVKRGKAIFPITMARAQAVGGTLQQWRDRVAEPLSGQTIPMIVVLAALAAPIIRFFDEENFGIELHGPGGKGKTLCQRIAQSIAGQPTTLPSFNSTQSGLERLFARHSDMILPINEGSLISEAHKTAFKNFAFNMANGSPRITAFTGEPAVHRFLYLTSSNESLHRKVGETDAYTENSALQRLIPLEVSGEPRGAFSFIPSGFASPRKFAKSIEAAIKEQYGTPYRELIRHLVIARHEDAAEFDDKIRRRCAKFFTEIGASTADDGESRVSASIGLLYAVGCFAKAKGILPVSWNCMTACVDAYRNFQAQQPSMTPLAARLATILARPETLDLRNGARPKMKEKAFETHGAFLHSGIKGRTELLLTRNFWRCEFPDRHQIIAGDDFRLLKGGKGKRGEGQRRIRAGKGREWFVCFKLPAALIPPLST